MTKKVTKIVTDNPEVFLILNGNWTDPESPQIAYQPPPEPSDDVALILDLIADGASHCGYKPPKDKATNK
jgi:hypothetical protein